MEGGRRFNARPIESLEAERSRVEDTRIRAALADPESERALFEHDSVGWLRGAIGLDTGRGASEISDRELVVRLVEYGRYEWDPLVARSVAAYLRNQGIPVIY